MEKSLIERYKAQMLEMYGKKPRTVNVQNTANMPDTHIERQESSLTTVDDNTATGNLLGVVTSVRSLYFVPGARVTVFTGTPQNMQIIDTDTTNENGRTKAFALPTPKRGLSMDSANTETPYALYNMMVEADGYITNIHLNIPVFPSITSIQPSNLLLLETAGVDKGPRIFDEKQNYNL